MDPFLQFFGEVREIFVFDSVQRFHRLGERETLLINKGDLLSHAEGGTEFEEGLRPFRT